VQWDSLQPNFFLMFAPGLLDAMAGTWMASAQYRPQNPGQIAELVRRFPGVSIFDLDQLIAQVRSIVDKAVIAVQSVFLFTLLAGMVVLLAAVQATRDERRYESAMLRTFGASRRRVLGGVAAEFVAIGLLAGLLASSGATLAGFLLAENLFDLQYRFSPVLWLAGPLLGMVFVGLSGLAATWRVITRAPLNVLRAV
jgi:putative ABC transport system permease protein